MADLLYLDTIEKLTGEQWTEQFDFNGIIPENTTVASHGITVLRNDGTDVTSSVVDSSSHATTIVSVVLKSLTSEASYLIKVTGKASDNTDFARAKLLHVTPLGAYK